MGLKPAGRRLAVFDGGMAVATGVHGIRCLLRGARGKVPWEPSTAQALRVMHQYQATNISARHRNQPLNGVPPSSSKAVSGAGAGHHAGAPF